MSSSMQEALKKIGVEVKEDTTEERRGKKAHKNKKPLKTPFYLQKPFTQVHKSNRYSAENGSVGIDDVTNLSKHDINILALLKENTNRVYLLPSSTCYMCCNIWLAYNKKFNRFAIRGIASFKVRDIPAHTLKHPQMRKLMDQYKITLDASILDVAMALDGAGRESLISILYGNSTIPIVFEV